MLPGLIGTDMWERTAPELGESNAGTVEEVFAEWSTRVQVDRHGPPGEVADLIVFLASARATYINGAAIDVGGGMAASTF